MSQLQYDVLVLGDYFFDQVYTGLPQLPELGREVYSTALTSTGGAMFITAVALHRLDVRVGWPVYFGNDYYSRSVRAAAQKEGLDLALEKQVNRPYRRVTTSLPFGGERAFITYTDPEADDLYDHWLASMARCDFAHVHIGGLLPLPVARPILELARARGATISMDCQDVPLLYSGCEFKKLLAMLDVVTPNAREALLMAGTDRLEDALQTLSAWCPVVIVKAGSEGAWLAQQGRVQLVGGICAGEVVDTTGAGDCFNAGFLRGYVVEQSPLEVAVRYGNICGGLSVTGVGGATNAPTYRELRCWLEQGKPCD